jgi:hypothetical protein
MTSAVHWANFAPFSSSSTATIEVQLASKAMTADSGKKPLLADHDGEERTHKSAADKADAKEVEVFESVSWHPR